MLSSDGLGALNKVLKFNPVSRLDADYYLNLYCNKVAVSYILNYTWVCVCGWLLLFLFVFVCLFFIYCLCVCFCGDMLFCLLFFFFFLLLLLFFVVVFFGFVLGFFVCFVCVLWRFFKI